MKKNKLSKLLQSKQGYIITILLVLHFILSVTSVYNDSLTWDEKCYAGQGRYLIETGNFRTEGGIYHAPFSYYLNSLFIFFLDIPQSTWQHYSCWEVGNNLVFNSGYDPQLIVFLIRLPFILLSLFLGFYVFRWAKELYGSKAGLFALFIYCLSPSIMSTSRLAMTDFPVVTFIFISTYYFWRFNSDNSRKNLILTGVFLGLALISKITALYLIPILIILSLLKLNKEQLNKKIIYKQLKKRIISFGLIFLIIFVIIFTAYNFSVKTLASTLPDHYKKRAYEEFDSRLNDGMIKDLVLFMFNNLPLPAANYITVIGDVAFYSGKGFSSFLLGKVYDADNKPWYYFIILYLVKTPIPSIIFLLLTIIFFRRIRHKNKINELYLILPSVLLFLPFMFNPISVDLRHILTIYPFIFVFISKITNIRFNEKKKQNIKNFSFIILLVWYAVSTLAIYPYYIAYFNEFVLSENGYKVLSGANIDAGQDLIRLKHYLNQNNIKKINLSFHGAVDPENYGIDYDYMPTACFSPINKYYKPYAENCNEDYIEDCSERKGTVVVSVTNLQGRFLRNQSCFNWLKNKEPIKKIGYSMFIYDIKD